MLTREGTTARRARLWRSLPGPCDAVVITTPEGLTYLSGYAPSPLVFNTVESAAALLLLGDRSILIGDNLLRPFLDRSHADEIVSLEWYTGRKSAGARRLSILRAIHDRLPTQGCRLGVESSACVAPASHGCLLLDDTIRRLRRHKDLDELGVLNRSARAGEAAHAAALQNVKPGMSELQVFLLVQSAASEALGEPAIVYGDFVSGPRVSTEQGGPPTSRIIEQGDLLLLDFSVVVQGYRTDFTNTFVVGASPTDPHRELYEQCLDAMAAGEAKLRPDVPARAVDEAVRGHFRTLGLADRFPSHSGHGLGLGHPEPPYLVPESEETLSEGDVVALEPGLYIPGVGGMRFERNYRITSASHELLTHHRLTLGS
jgi:Xaa-Pro aminopeptidase